MSKRRPWKMTLEELLHGTGGMALAEHSRTFSGVGTDTREDLRGKIFFALKGENFDAHDFLIRAVEAGAEAVVVHRLPQTSGDLIKTITVVQVDDTLEAMQSL